MKAHSTAQKPIFRQAEQPVLPRFTASRRNRPGDTLRFDHSRFDHSRKMLLRRVVIQLIAAFALAFANTGCSNLRVPKQDGNRQVDDRFMANPLGTKLQQVWKSRPRLRHVEPSLNRLWRPDLAILPYAEFDENQITIRNVRNCRYRTEENYDVRHYDLEFDINDVQGVDFLIVPFTNSPLLAHTMLSFGLRDGRHFIVSVETRLEQGENYSMTGGSDDEYELMYLVGDERDLIPLRTQVRLVDVYLYRGRVTPDQAQNLLVDVLARVNKLAREPEFYNTFTNNCTTNLVQHVNNIHPGAVPMDLRVMLPGLSDSLAYDLGLLDINGTFEVAKMTSRINTLVELYKDDPDFSTKIRLK